MSKRCLKYLRTLRFSPIFHPSSLRLGKPVNVKKSVRLGFETADFGVLESRFVIVYTLSVKPDFLFTCWSGELNCTVNCSRAGLANWTALWTVTQHSATTRMRVNKRYNAAHWRGHRRSIHWFTMAGLPNMRPSRNLFTTVGHLNSFSRTV
jgi:hypothetical protein